MGQEGLARKVVSNKWDIGRSSFTAFSVMNLALKKKKKKKTSKLHSGFRVIRVIG